MPIDTNIFLSASEIGERLELLLAERALAPAEGLGDNRLFMEDLESEIATTRAAYVGTAVTEIATLRARLDGPLQG